MPQVAAHPRHLVQDRAGVVDERIAGFSRRHTAPPTIEQHDFAGRLHITQAFTCGGQRQTDVSRAVSDAARIHHSQKKAKIRQVKTHGARLDVYQPSV